MSNVFELPAHDGEAARDLSPADWARLERNAAEIFEALGLDLDTPGTRDTPRRFVRALFDATAGYDGDAKLRTVFPAERPEDVEGRHAQIVEGPVGFYALCEHHALPFFGHAYVGYIACRHIIGISKLTRLVRLFASRFTVQERVGQQIAETRRRSSNRTAWRSIWRPITSALRCGACGRPRPGPARPPGGAITPATPGCVPNSSPPAGRRDEGLRLSRYFTGKSQLEPFARRSL